MWIRQFLSIVLLPFTAVVLVPLWIARRYGVDVSPATSLAGWVARGVGAAFLSLGLVFFTASVRRFAVEGRGTLAPWDPPRELVIRGLYRYVRNPMISGVVFILFGEALLLVSRPHALWAAAFLGVNLVYIPLIEEPQLEQRFGAAYREYSKHVPRIVPRLRPWVK